MFKRNILREGGMVREAHAGDALSANLVPTNFNAEADATLTVAQIAGGKICQGLTLTSDVVYTLPTAILLAAALEGMNTGDAFSFIVNNSQAAAFDVVIAVGVGITAIGTNNSLSVAPQSSRIFTVIMTDDTDGAETFDLY